MSYLAKGGNDLDFAALLTSMLPFLDAPSLYATADARMTNADFATWLGVGSLAEAEFRRAQTRC